MSAIIHATHISNVHAVLFYVTPRFVLALLVLCCACRMPPVKQQPSLGTQLQLEQNFNNLELAPSEKELQKMEKADTKAAELKKKIKAKLEKKNAEADELAKELAALGVDEEVGNICTRTRARSFGTF